MVESSRESQILLPYALCMSVCVCLSLCARMNFSKLNRKLAHECENDGVRLAYYSHFKSVQKCRLQRNKIKLGYSRKNDPFSHPFLALFSSRTQTHHSLGCFLNGISTTASPSLSQSQVGGYFKKITVMAPSCTLTIHTHRDVLVCAFHLNIFIDSQTHPHPHSHTQKIFISPSSSFFPFSRK